MSAPFSVLFSRFLYAFAVISKRLLMTRENKIVCQILFNGNALKIFPLCKFDDVFNCSITIFHDIGRFLLILFVKFSVIEIPFQ